MALYRTDFREYTTGAAPSDWTGRWVSGLSPTVQADGAVTGGKRLRLPAAGTTGRRGLSWNRLDADGDRANADVLVRWRIGTAAFAQLRPFTRGSGASAAETMYVCGVDESVSGVRLHKYVAGTSTTISSAAFEAAKNTWYWTRFRSSGTALEVTVWSGAYEDEPTSATLSGADASISAAGWIGLFNFGTAEYDVDVFAVGTGGDIATPYLAPETTVTIGTITPSGTGASVAFTGLDPYATGLEYRLDGGSWVSAGGTTSPITISGLAESTEYDIEMRATNAAGASAASTLATFTTTAGAVVKGVREILYNGATPVGAITGITALWWDATTPSGAPDYETTSAATNGSGEMTLDLDATTTLNVDDPGFLLLYKLDGTDHEDSLMFAGRFIVKDIG